MTNEQSNRPPVAIVGVSALFPGSVDSTGFWSDILAGTDRMTSVPATHWLIDDHYDPDPSTPDKTYGRRGGFLDPIDFDALGFGVPPSALASTDTAQLLALIVAQRVLDDAVRGQFVELDRSRASVILGVTSGQELLGAMASRMNRPMWLQGMRRAGIAEDVAQEACDRILALHPEWTESTFPGLLGNVVAGRIANRLDLGGTNCVTDAACASSFSAMSMGINELYLGDSDLVIAGGVDTMNDIFMYMCFSKTPALSKTEDVRPFSDEADGTMLGEGIGMVALKRLADAERDGNDIYCIVNGVGASSDGRSKSVYAPVSSGQARALEQAYAKAGYGPDSVELVEAHGTGTVAGDAAEFGGLELTFDASGRQDRQWCALGSVKSQIGHTKAAAGAAGLFKVVMALHHRVLPQTAKIDRPNPELDLDHSPFYLNTRTRPWVRGSDHERRGSVSSFGFGGSNFHVTMSEYRGEGVRAPRLRTADVELVILCGVDGSDILATAARHLDDATRNGALRHLAQTSQLAYDASAPARLAITATDEADLADKLRQAISRIEADRTGSFSMPTGIHFRTGGHTGDIAFLFPGQGSQYLSMGAELAMSFSEAMDAWDLAADQDWDGPALQDIVFPPTSFADRADEVDLALLTATHWAQPAIGTTSLGLLRVLRAIGIEPQHVGGHSFGEVTAMCAAGAVSDDDMLRIARRRGSLMAEAAQTPGSMTAVTGTIDDVRRIADGSSADVVIANHNSPRQVVLSGPTPAIETIERELSAAGIAAKRLPVATAFHSSVVSGAGEAFGTFLDGVTFTAPTTTLYSNETAAPYPDTDPTELRSHLARQLSRPVRFVEMIEAMYERGARTFVEVGPGGVLTGLVDTILDDRDHLAVPLDRKGRAGLFGFFDGIGRLAAAGVAMDLGALWREYGTMIDPDDAPAPKLAIAISGANADRPYPPQDLADLVGPNPPVDTPTTLPMVAATPSAPPTPPVASDTVTAVTPATSATQSSGPRTAPDAGLLAAFQTTQEQTAAAHTAYLESMARAHAAYLDAAQAGIAALSRLAGSPAAAGVGPDEQSIVQPLLSTPPPAATIPPPVTPVPDRPAPRSDPQPAASSDSTDQGAPASVDMLATLLDVVSERTGYPADMLTTDMELESDLGIDSIKRVEILSAMQDNVPDLPDVDLAVLAGLATLGQIVDYLTEQLHQHRNEQPANDDHLNGHHATDLATATVAATNGSNPVRAGDLGRFVVEAVPTEPSGHPCPDLFDGPVVVTDEGAGVAEALVTMLCEHGVDANCGPAGGANAHRMIYLGNLRRPRDADEARTFNADAFSAAKACAVSPGDDGLFVAVDDQQGASDGGTRAWAGGLTGLARTASIEWPSVTVRLIDVERAERSVDRVAHAIADELLRGADTPDVRLSADGERFVTQLTPTSLHVGTLPLGASDVVVVSGGGRGVTAATMIELARASGATFVLLGRSELADEPARYATASDDAELKRLVLDDARATGDTLTPLALDEVVGATLANREIDATISAISDVGGRAIYVAVDITDLDAVERALATIRADVGPITGVVHGAGVLADKLIVDKTPTQFAHVFDTKVGGLRNLLTATDHDDLRVLCLFSSIAARTGNAGQADYAMANEVLNRVAIDQHRRRGDRCVVKSIGWGPWSGGMVTPELARHFESIGVGLIPIDVGARMLVDELAGAQRDQVEVFLGGDVVAIAEPPVQRVGV
ncbi:MAG: SDR family NAD(P)-dependent oxidoreductase [Ilumatobacteraceae bacterium]